MNFKPHKKGIFKGPKAKQFRKNFKGKKETRTELLDLEIKTLTEKYDQIDPSECKSFKDFPLSQLTLQGLKASKFESPTDIQRESLVVALQGHDILGAAKTGSGKTLAFLVPVLECLYRNKWSKLDGLGALIISPTRELAYQTFEVLKRVGKYHNFSAGLVIGGKPLKEEVGRINQTNIVICTPGRLLQHMDETAYFTADTLQMLVLDEADRILDMGFQQSMNAIIENLPPERQTVLFSATQTRSVKDLARLSLKDPMFVSVHENASKSTPNKLEQNYIVCDLHDKINMIWSFLKNHLKSKILVFLSSCKQVKYITEAMNMLRPGIPLMCLHGSMPQLRRVAVYNQFLWKQHACLFATDIAARGLDFPSINWVIQLDCPEDPNTYIHRAGRTARYEKDGEALLVLLPSEEEEMVKQLEDKKIPIEKINVNQRRFFSIQHKMEANCASDVTLKESAQRAFVAYLKSVFLMHNKKVFNVHSLDLEAFARSLGLAITPKLRFLKKDQIRLEEKEKKELAMKKSKANTLKQTPVANSSSESDSSSESGSESTEEENSKSESSGDSDSSDSDKKELNAKSDGKDRESLKFDVDDSDDELFSVRRNVQLEETEEDQVNLEDLRKNSKQFQKVKTRKQLAELLKKKNMSINTKVKFDEEGEVEEDQLKAALRSGDIETSDEEEVGGGIDIETAKKRMQKEDLADKETYRAKIKKDHKEKRMKLKEERRKKREERRMEQGLDEELIDVKLPSDGEEDDGDADPLSFLPDPDQVYGGNQSDDSGTSDSESDRPSQAKRRKVASNSSSDEDDDDDDDDGSDGDDDDDDSDNDDDDDEEEETKQSLRTDEELALMLLQGKR